MIRLDKKWLIFAVLMLVAQVLVAPLSCAADWPMFGHDPQRNNVAGESVGPPLELPGESAPVISMGALCAWVLGIAMCMRLTQERRRIPRWCRYIFF